MIKIGHKIVYRDKICTVKEIIKCYRNDEDYYVLTDVNDPTLLIKVPLTLAETIMRPLITRDEIDSLIKKIPNISTVSISNWNRGAEYKTLLRDGTHESVISVIKTAYQRQQDKIDDRKKPSESDKIYFRQAENLFYSEIAAALNIDFDEARDYIVTRTGNFSVAK